MPTLAELAFGRPVARAADVTGAIRGGLDARAQLQATSAADSAGERRQNIDRLFSGGIPDDPAERALLQDKAFALGGADTGFQVMEAFRGLSAIEREEQARESRIVATNLFGANDQATWERAIANIQAQGVDTSAIPPAFDENFRNVSIAGARGLESLIASSELPPTVLSPGQIAVDRTTGDTVATGPVPAGDPRTDAELFSQANALRDEFVKQTESYIEASRGLAKVEAGADDETGSGDVALIFGFMKTIDPESTVREGEFATAEQTTNIPGQIVAIYNRLLDPNAPRLTPQQRVNFVASARSQFASITPQYESTVAEYDRLARSFNIDPAQVIINRVAAGGAAPGGTISPTGSAPSAAAGKDISAMSLDELNALDRSTLTPAEREAAAQRWDDLNAGR